MKSTSSILQKPSFDFNLLTNIKVGEGLLAETGKLTKTITEGNRVLIVTDSGIRRTGIADKVWISLDKEGFYCKWFDSVEPNPKDEDCETGGEEAQRWKADVIVAVGGGSVLDSAKAIALLQTNHGRIQDFVGRDRVLNEVTPVVAIPTTSGTGSEVTYSAVITDINKKVKMTIKDRKLAPKLAIVDPETTYALPAHITASTGMDAFVHAIEAYTCRLANPLSDAMAQGAMEKIFQSLREAVLNGENKEARYNMMVGSLMAGIAFSHADVAAVHCMAEALGGLYDTPHGVANSIFLPSVTAYNAEKDPEKHARVARICGLPTAGISDKEAALLLVEELKLMAKDIGIPAFRSLPYVKQSDFPQLADVAFSNGSTPSNCREINREDYLNLFHKNYE
ncbi:iron-containing alcohol dehydrogenase [Cytobacillus depressus]|uniref:Iron-containing alcohol dehydrogenase n=1 Tax=Cytobacillus depressus TaxID=1602942 RepID=A0A6L3UZ76_9BACI|nr:iron-containing alcohol dehydrogenase [Cytobacillus depressus]KAB2329560.1 iron-containing alcohol dehydrogenase [Cytobacillus depressus]